MALNAPRSIDLEFIFRGLIPDGNVAYLLWSGEGVTVSIRKDESSRALLFWRRHEMPTVGRVLTAFLWLTTGGNYQRLFLEDRVETHSIAPFERFNTRWVSNPFHTVNFATSRFLRPTRGFKRNMDYQKKVLWFDSQTDCGDRRRLFLFRISLTPPGWT